MSLARLILIYASIVAALGTAGRYLFAAIRWIYGWARNIDLMAHFIHAMHENHLPHIYKRLGRIEDGLGLPREEPPLDSPIPNSQAKDP